MQKRMWVLWLIVLVLAAGCGRGKAEAQAPSAPQSSSDYRSPSAPENEAYGESAPPSVGLSQQGYPAPAPAASPPPDGAAAARAPSAAPPRERPGLGTEWGETRESRVHDVSFARANATTPFAMAQLFYNDRRGVEAQATFHGRDADRRRALLAAGGASSVAINDSSGDPLEGVNAGGRTYVVGESGERYTIVITNHTGSRFEAVATVDGLDVISGRAGALSNRGYILMPYATLEIDGFRQSQDAVAAFRFAPVGDSYAAKTGSARNVGVIGVAFFSERGDSFPAPWTDGELRRRETANPFPSDPRFARPPR
jgi:hypothetical protein